MKHYDRSQITVVPEEHFTVIEEHFGGGNWLHCTTTSLILAQLSLCFVVTGNTAWEVDQ